MPVQQRFHITTDQMAGDVLPLMKPESTSGNSLHEYSDITPRSLSVISMISGFIWLIAGFIVITLFHDQSITGILLSGKQFTLQLFSGAISGLLFGWLGVLMLNHESFRKTLNDYSIIRILKETPLSKPLIIQISLIAGITEEFLFRAAIQPLFGIWLTSLIFIAIHRYIRYKTVNHLLFTIFTFTLSMMLGYLFIFFGLLSAIIAHAVYDFLLLTRLMNQHKSGS